MRILSAAALAVLGITAVAGSAHATQAGEKCSDIDISVTNRHPSGDPIKVLYVEYWTDWSPVAEWHWETEGLDNKVLNPSVTVTWNNQTLEAMYDGEVGTYWRVYYKRQLTGGLFPSYGDTHYQQFERFDHPCEDGDSYSFTVDDWGQTD